MDTYEKKYNEALKWMRELYPGLHGATKEDAEHFFPELRESEEERVRKCLIAMVNATIWDSSNIASKKACLAWLEKQKEQKPAEWSEEDEDMLNCCISSIEEAKENRYAYKETDGDTSYDREIAWLKSLCPDSYKNCNSRWKPSEEQMEALRRAVNKLAKTDVADSVRLSIMYDNLKRL